MTDNTHMELLNINGTLYQTRLSGKFRNRSSYKPSEPGRILSFIPGTVTEVFVSPGQRVSKGELLLILDAMKMQNRVKCPEEGTVVSVAVKKGDRVSKGGILLELDLDLELT